MHFVFPWIQYLYGVMLVLKALHIYWLRFVELLWLWLTPEGYLARAIRSGKVRPPQVDEPAPELNAPALEPEKTPEELEAEAVHAAAMSDESITAARARLKKHFAAKQKEGRNSASELAFHNLSVLRGKEVTIEVPVTSLESPPAAS